MLQAFKIKYLALTQLQPFIVMAAILPFLAIAVDSKNLKTKLKAHILQQQFLPGPLISAFSVINVWKEIPMVGNVPGLQNIREFSISTDPSDGGLDPGDPLRRGAHYG